MTGANAEQQARGRGRPRDAEKDAAIREAAWRILAEKGYEAFTFEAVADCAGCSRSTLYRRFANKAELVEAALGATARLFEPVTGEGMAPRDALIAHATALRAYMAAPRGPAMLSIMVNMPHHPELAAALQRHQQREQAYYFREFDRLFPEGIAPEKRDFAFHTLIGSIVFHVAVRRAAPGDTQIAQLVDHAIGLLRE